MKKVAKKKAAAPTKKIAAVKTAAKRQIGHAKKSAKVLAKKTVSSKTTVRAKTGKAAKAAGATIQKKVVKKARSLARSAKKALVSFEEAVEAKVDDVTSALKGVFTSGDSDSKVATH